MIRIDVSEIKQRRTCGRQWQYGSRNAIKLSPKVQPTALRFGTFFHECLHALYLGATIEKVMTMITNTLTDELEVRVITNMLTGYYDTVLQNDFDQYLIVDVEYGFKIEDMIPDVALCGSIDMIAVDKETNEVWGFEHKSAKSFKSPFLMKMDEQPRVYYIALTELVKKMNGTENKYTVGGIIMNEVKKVQKKFEIQRTVCKYSDENQCNFIKGLFMTCNSIIEGIGVDLLPEPSMMKCQMCSFSTICEDVQYSNVDTTALMDRFAEEYYIRDVDHLDEKAVQYESLALDD